MFFNLLRENWFGLAKIAICSHYKLSNGRKQGVDHQISNRKCISHKIMHPQSFFFIHEKISNVVLCRVSSTKKNCSE